MSFLFQPGYCIPQNRNNTCTIIRGRAVIYLDTGVTEARDLAYLAIHDVLSDPTYVILFEPDAVYTRFLRSISENVFLISDDNTNSDSMDLDENYNSTSLTIAISVSSIIFIVACAVSIGFLRQQTMSNRKMVKPQVNIEAIGKKNKRDRRPYFQSMDSEDSASDGPFVLISPDHDGRFSTWSDITSDSGSITSLLSRTTVGTRLQKIDEEPESERNAEIDASWDLQAPLSSHYSRITVKNTGRLQDLVRNACSDSDFFVMKDPAGQENSFPPSFGVQITDYKSWPRAGAQFDPANVEHDQKETSSSSSIYCTPRSQASDEIIEDKVDERKRLRFCEVESMNGELSLREIFNMDTLDSMKKDQFSNAREKPVLHSRKSVDSSESDASLQTWLSRLLLELHITQQRKRIEL
jgi:hypothetical protein